MSIGSLVSRKSLSNLGQQIINLRIKNKQTVLIMLYVEIIARVFQFSSLSISNIKISGRVFHLLCECRLRDVHFRVGINVGFPDLTGPLYEDHLQFLWRKQSMRSMV